MRPFSRTFGRSRRELERASLRRRALVPTIPANEGDDDTDPAQICRGERAARRFSRLALKKDVLAGCVLLHRDRRWRGKHRRGPSMQTPVGTRYDQHQCPPPWSSTVARRSAPAPKRVPFALALRLARRGFSNHGGRLARGSSARGGSSLQRPRGGSNWCGGRPATVTGRLLERVSSGSLTRRNSAAAPPCGGGQAMAEQVSARLAAPRP